MKPSALVKRAIADGVDQTALETAQDGESPREDIIALILAKAAEPARPKSRKEQLRDYLEPVGYAPYTEAVAAALYAAEIPSKGWLNELDDIEVEGQLLEFLRGIKKAYTPEGVLRSELAEEAAASSAAAAGRGGRSSSSGGSGDPALDAAKASLFGGGGGGGKRQSAADTADDANRSALFAGSKKPADWSASRKDTPADPIPSSAALSARSGGGGGGGGGGAIGPSAQVLEAQQRVRANLESLGDLGDRTKQMEENSQQFASMATQLRKKKQFGLF
jgi:hypothetical protein